MRHVSRTRSVALECFAWRNQLAPQDPNKYVDTKNQPADMLTKGLLNIMNFTMFSCCHFLSNRKQSATSKEAQQRKIEGLAVAKPMSACLVSRNVHLDAGASQVSGNQDLGWNAVQGSTGKPSWDRVHNVAAGCQEWQKDDKFVSGKHKDSCAECVCERSRVQWKLCEASRPTLKGQGWSVTICNSPTNDTSGKSSRIHLQEDRIFWRVNRTDTWSKDQCIDVGIVYVNNDESISSPWAKLQWRFDCVQEHQLQGAQGVPRYAEFDPGTCIRDSKRFHDWVVLCPLDEIFFASWQGKIQRFQRIQRFFGFDGEPVHNLEVESLSMSLFNDIEWTKKGVLQNVLRIPKRPRIMKKGYPRTWVILRPRRRGQTVWYAHLKESGMLLLIWWKISE